MDLNELIDTLESRRKGISYKLWKEAYLITLGISDLFREKGKQPQYPSTPDEASPEFCSTKGSMKKPDFLKNKRFKKEGDMMIYGRKI